MFAVAAVPLMFATDIHAADKYGIGTRVSLPYLKHTLSVSFSDTFGPEKAPSCLLNYDAITNSPLGVLRYSGSFGRSTKYPDMAGIMTASLTMVGPGNSSLTPARPWMIYVKSSSFSARENIKRRSEFGDSGILLEFTNKIYIDHMFYRILEDKQAWLVIIKDYNGRELTSPPLDLMVVDSTANGDQVRNTEALDAFRKCMRLQHEPAKPGEEYRFYR